MYKEILAKINSAAKNDNKLSLELLEKTIADIRWPAYYTPIFNTLPKTENGEFPVPHVLLGSSLFSLSDEPEQYVNKRIVTTPHDLGTSMDEILFSGKALTDLDKLIFFKLLQLHNFQKVVGRELITTQCIFETEFAEKISPITFEKSLFRLHDCRISIPAMNFYGPFISSYRNTSPCGVQNPNYSIYLNPELTRLFYDPMFIKYMEEGSLFFHKPFYENNHGDYRGKIKELSTLKQTNPTEYMQAIKRTPWPTQKSDVAAMYAIHAKHQCQGPLRFLESVPSSADEVRIPDFLIDAIEHFLDLYGSEVGQVVCDLTFEKVYGLCFEG